MASSSARVALTSRWTSATFSPNFVILSMRIRESSGLSGSLAREPGPAVEGAAGDLERCLRCQRRVLGGPQDVIDLAESGVDLALQPSYLQEGASSLEAGAGSVDRSEGGCRLEAGVLHLGLRQAFLSLLQVRAHRGARTPGATGPAGRRAIGASPEAEHQCGDTHDLRAGECLSRRTSLIAPSSQDWRDGPR